ncbi:hypothetical protein Efla_004053 [Eimeria flavescens]
MDCSRQGAERIRRDPRQIEGFQLTRAARFSSSNPSGVAATALWVEVASKGDISGPHLQRRPGLDKLGEAGDRRVKDTRTQGAARESAPGTEQDWVIRSATQREPINIDEELQFSRRRPSQRGKAGTQVTYGTPRSQGLIRAEGNQRLCYVSRSRSRRS